MRKAGKGYTFAIEKLDTKEFLGTCGLYIIGWKDRSANLGIAIHAEKNWNKGYGTDATKVLLKFGFDYLNLHRIGLSVYPSNTRAIRVYEKVGFTQIGRKRQARFMNGEYHDEILMDILREEWNEKE